MANLRIKNLIAVIQKRFHSLQPIPSSSSSLTVDYLVNSCGLSLKSALSVSQKLQMDENTLKRAESVLNLFKSSGFQDTHIAKLVEKWPVILNCGVESNLKQKVDYLKQFGFTGKILAHFIVSNPFIFRKSLDDHIKPAFDLLKQLLGSNENVISASKGASWLFTTNVGVMKRNIDFLINEGMPIISVSRLVMLCPRVLSFKLDSTLCNFKAVRELGLEPNSTVFIYALRIKVSLSEANLKKRIETFKSLGWTEEQILHMFKRDPNCFGFAENNVKDKMDFFINTMKLKPEYIIDRPKFLTYGLDRIRLRYNFLKFLQSKELLEWDKNKIAGLLIIPEKRFIEKYVDGYNKDLPGILEIYNGSTLVQPNSRLGK